MKKEAIFRLEDKKSIHEGQLQDLENSYVLPKI